MQRNCKHRKQWLWTSCLVYCFFGTSQRNIQVEVLLCECKFFVLHASPALSNPNSDFLPVGYRG